MKAKIKRADASALPTRAALKIGAGSLRQWLSLAVLIGVAVLLSPQPVRAQENSYRVWGDIKIDDSKADTPGPSSVTVILYDPTGRILGRQTVSNHGRYRFNVTPPSDELQSGSYELAIETDSGEITRMTLTLTGLRGSDIRQDFEFEWKSKSAGQKSVTGVISAADVYNRPSANKSLFQKAQEAVGKKKYEQAVTFLRQIVDGDKADFQAWTLLGTVYLVQEKSADAEKAYLSAIEARPTFSLALLDLGRMRSSQKKFEEAIDPLTRAIQSQPDSAEANLLLGEAYLQLRKGSKAIGYLNEAARLGRPEAHLRLGWLYNAAGMKDKAVVEYEEFLKKRPDYSERKKIEEYISTNKKG
jgi:Flp pilus assembly protein TadD